MLKIKKGDKVKVLLGKDKGREGFVEKIYPKTMKAVVPEVNLYKRHVKGKGGVKSDIYQLPRPLNLSKLAVICPLCKKPTRVGFRMAGNEKVRFCKKCKKEINVSKGK